MIISKDKILQYIDSLANGIDPMTGESLGNDTILNRPDIIRVLFAAKYALEAKPNKKATSIDRNEPYQIVDDNILLEGKTTITGFVSAIHEKNAEHNAKKLSYKLVVNWLINEGYLMLNENNKKVPTQKGESIGISIERHFGKFGYYMVITYNETAQRFILKNLVEGNVQKAAM